MRACACLCTYVCVFVWLGLYLLCTTYSLHVIGTAVIDSQKEQIEKGAVRIQQLEKQLKDQQKINGTTQTQVSLAVSLTVELNA